MRAHLSIERNRPATMKITGTRTYFEVRVGRFQSAEVLLHLRRSDVPWFQQNGEVLQPELLRLLQSSVLPRLFADEIEQNHAAICHTKPPPNLGPGGVPITIGEKNTQKKKAAATKATTANNNTINDNKRKRGLSKKKQAELKRQQEEAAREQRKNEKDIYYATGETIRIAYRLEPASASGATLLFRNDDDGDGDESSKKHAGFRALKKLSKRILVWCYPANAEQPVSEGFLRPEVLPIASLFRMPASEVSATASTTTRKEVIVLEDDD